MAKPKQGLSHEVPRLQGSHLFSFQASLVRLRWGLCHSLVMPISITARSGIKVPIA